MNRTVPAEPLFSNSFGDDPELFILALKRLLY